MTTPSVSNWCEHVNELLDEIRLTVGIENKAKICRDLFRFLSQPDVDRQVHQVDAFREQAHKKSKELLQYSILQDDPILTHYYRVVGRSLLHTQAQMMACGLHHRLGLESPLSTIGPYELQHVFQILQLTQVINQMLADINQDLVSEDSFQKMWQIYHSDPLSSWARERLVAYQTGTQDRFFLNPLVICECPHCQIGWYVRLDCTRQCLLCQVNLPISTDRSVRITHVSQIAPWIDIDTYCWIVPPPQIPDEDEDEDGDEDEDEVYDFYDDEDGIIAFMFGEGT